MIDRFLPPRARALLRTPWPWVLLVYGSGIVLRVIYTLDIQRPQDLILSDMDFYVVLARPGKRVARRKNKRSIFGNFQKISKEESKQWFIEKLGGTVL